MTTKAMVALVVVFIVLSPVDVPPQCDSQVFARSNPGLCYSLPFPDLPDTGGGGAPGGGLLGTIGRVLHNLTGGLL